MEARFLVKGKRHWNSCAQWTGILRKRNKNMIRQKAISFIAAIILLQVLGCHRTEVPTSVIVGNGPSFSFRGSGRLDSFTVSAPLNGQKIAEGCTARLFPCAGRATSVWQIQAASEYLKGSNVNGLHLQYGKVPEGYAQLVPPNSQPAPTLGSGVIYAFFAETTGAPGIAEDFYVQPSGAIDTVDVSDLCKRMKNGQWVRVNCKTDQPYEEPADMEKFVREHAKSQAAPNR